MKNAKDKGHSKIIPKERPPSRPFTPYNVFFQLERERILQEHGEGYAAIPPSVEDAHASARPPSYRNLILAEDWYIAGSKRKDGSTDKKKRRVHGILTFVQLSKLISQNWASADKQVKEYCTFMSQENTRRYRMEMDAYIEKYGYESVKRTNKKRKEYVKLNERALVCNKSKKVINQDKQQGGTVDDCAAQNSKLSTKPPVPPVQNSLNWITSIMTKSYDDLMTNSTSLPSTSSQFLSSIDCCIPINPFNAVNGNCDTMIPSCPFQFRDNSSEDDSNTNAGNIHLFRHQISQARPNNTLAFPEMSSINNFHVQFHDSPPIQNEIPIVDIEPLPIGDDCNEDIIIRRDETPIPLNPQTFDWSFDYERLEGNVLQNPRGNSSSFYPMGSAAMNLLNTNIRRISSYDPSTQESMFSTMLYSGEDEISKESPLRRSFCFTAQDIESSSFRSDQNF